MAGSLQPLDQKFAIADANGNPTEYFIRWAQQKQIDIGDSITLADLQTYLTEHALREGSGIQFTPDGNLVNSPLVAADAQEILDQISATRGAMLYRGLLGWSVLLPGTSGFFLQTSGAGADPTWAAAGGGGSALSLLPFNAFDGHANANIALTGTLSLFVTPCVALSNSPVTKLRAPFTTVAAARKCIGVIYDGGLFSAFPTVPTGAALVAQSPIVAAAGPILMDLTFTTPFVPTVGKLYYVGLHMTGDTTAFNIIALNVNRGFWITSTVLAAPPAAIPAGMASGSNTAPSFWTE